MDILNSTILANQDSYFLEISFSWYSSLAMNGLRLASARDEVVLVRVIPRYEIQFLLYV